MNECESKGGIYFTITEIIKLINEASWAKEKHLWLTNCIKIKESSSTNKSIEFKCHGDKSFFIKLMSSLQAYKIYEKIAA